MKKLRQLRRKTLLDPLQELAGSRIARQDPDEPLGVRQGALPLPALDVEAGRRVDDVGIARVELEGLEQRGLSLRVAAQPVEGQREVVAYPRPLRQEPSGMSQRVGRLTETLLFCEEQTQRVIELALVGRALDSL